jgi:DNA-binding NarL/FixJ family response regulator
MFKTIYMPALPRLRMLVAGDDGVDGLCARLALWPTVEIVGHARSANEARELTDDLSPDLVLMDLESPGFDDPAAIQRFKKRPGAPMLFVLTGNDTPDARRESFAAGADGVVTKAHPEEKLHALVARIRPYL